MSARGSRAPLGQFRPGSLGRKEICLESMQGKATWNDNQLTWYFKGGRKLSYGGEKKGNRDCLLSASHFASRLISRQKRVAEDVKFKDSAKSVLSWANIVYEVEEATVLALQVESPDVPKNSGLRK